MKKSKLQKLGHLACGSVLASSVVCGQDGDALIITADFLREEVQASKTGTARIDLPQSLTTLSAEEIQERGIRSISDVVNYTPGVNVSQGEGHRDAVVFRGVRSTADFYVDGVRDDVQYYRPLYNVEQLEVLRGPNALYFGRGGTGGVINRVLKKAKVGEEFNEYQTSIDTFGATSSQLDSNVDLNDQMAFRLNLHYDYLNNHRDYFDGNRYGLNPTLRYELSEDTTFDFSYEHMNHEQFIDRGIPTGANGEPVKELSGRVFGDEDLNFTTLVAHTFRASVQHTFSDIWRGRANLFYGTYDKFYQNFYASDYDAATRPGEVELDGYADRTQRQNFTLSGDVVGEFSLLSLEHKVLIGGEYTKTSSDQDRYNTNWSTNNDDQEWFNISNLNLRGGVVRDDAGNVLATNDFNTQLNDDTRVDIDTFSFFLQDEISITDSLDIIAGLRFDSFDIEVEDVKSGTTLSNSSNEVSPRLGIVYKPMDNLSLYASYSESFLPSSGEQYANLGGNKDRLDPNTFSNAELGVKWDLTEDLSFTFAGFQMDQSTAQFDEDTNRQFTVDSEIIGVEAQLKGSLTDRLSVSAGYSYLDGETASGDRPRELPENTFSFWGQYEITEQLGVGLGVIYQGDTLIRESGSESLPSYTRVDASAFYRISDDFRVQLNIENLFDIDYYPSSHSTHQATVGAPINARLTLVGRF